MRARLLLLAALALTGCERQPTTPAPPPAAPPPGAASQRPAAPPAGDDATTLATPKAASETPAAAPETTPVTAPPTRDLDAILFALEELEGTPADLEDPERDYEVRYEGKQALEDEAVALGPAAVDALLERLHAARDLPDVVGYRERRPFLCRVLARLEDDGARRAIEAALPKLPPEDVAALLEALPSSEASTTTVGVWLTRQVGFARNTGAGDPALRLALLEAYATRGGEAGDPAPLRAALQDPANEVRQRAKALTERD